MKTKYALQLMFLFVLLAISACGGDDTTVIIRSDFSTNENGQNGSGSGASITYVNKSDGSIHETTDIDRFLNESPED